MGVKAEPAKKHPTRAKGFLKAGKPLNFIEENPSRSGSATCQRKKYCAPSTTFGITHWVEPPGKASYSMHKLVDY